MYCDLHTTILSLSFQVLTYSLSTTNKLCDNMHVHVFKEFKKQT